jgi:hypothetical protein
LKYEPRQTKTNWKDTRGNVHEKPLFTGHVVLREIGFDERYSKLEQVSDLRDAGKSIKAAVAMIKLTEELYVSVNLKRGEREYLSVADLKNDPKCDTMLLEIASGLLEGFPDDEDAAKGN